MGWNESTRMVKVTGNKLDTDHIKHQINAKNYINDRGHKDGDEPGDHHCLVVLFYLGNEGGKRDKKE